MKLLRYFLIIGFSFVLACAKPPKPTPPPQPRDGLEIIKQESPVLLGSYTFKFPVSNASVVPPVLAPSSETTNVPTYFLTKQLLSQSLVVFDAKNDKAISAVPAGEYYFWFNEKQFGVVDNRGQRTFLNIYQVDPADTITSIKRVLLDSGPYEALGSSSWGYPLFFTISRQSNEIRAWDSNALLQAALKSSDDPVDVSAQKNLYQVMTLPKSNQQIRGALSLARKKQILFYSSSEMYFFTPKTVYSIPLEEGSEITNVIESPSHKYVAIATCKSNNTCKLSVFDHVDDTDKYELLSTSSIDGRETSLGQGSLDHFFVGKKSLVNGKFSAQTMNCKFADLICSNDTYLNMAHGAVYDPTQSKIWLTSKNTLQTLPAPTTMNAKASLDERSRSGNIKFEELSPAPAQEAKKATAITKITLSPYGNLAIKTDENGQILSIARVNNYQGKPINPTKNPMGQLAGFYKNGFLQIIKNPTTPIYSVSVVALAPTGSVMNHFTLLPLNNADVESLEWLEVKDELYVILHDIKGVSHLMDTRKGADITPQPGKKMHFSQTPGVIYVADSKTPWYELKNGKWVASKKTYPAGLLSKNQASNRMIASNSAQNTGALNANLSIETKTGKIFFSAEDRKLIYSSKGKNKSAKKQEIKADGVLNLFPSGNRKKVFVQTQAGLFMADFNLASGKQLVAIHLEKSLDSIQISGGLILIAKEDYLYVYKMANKGQYTLSQKIKLVGASSS